MSKLTVHGAKASSAATSKSDIVVVPLFTGEGLSSSASDVNAAAGDVLQRAISIAAPNRHHAGNIIFTHHGGYLS